MDRQQLQQFIQAAAGDLGSLRTSLLITAQNGDTSNLIVQSRDLTRRRDQAAELGQPAIADIIETCSLEIGHVADLDQCPPATAFQLLDLVARVEAALWAVPFDANDFLPDVSKFVDSSFEDLLPAVSSSAEVAEDGFEIDDETMEIFRSEAEELVANIEDALAALVHSPADQSAIWDLRRNSHTLKGAAGIVGLRRASELAHRMEDLLDNIVEKRLEPAEEVITFLRNSTRHLDATIASKGFDDDDGTALENQYQIAVKWLATGQTTGRVPPGSDADIAKTAAQPAQVKPEVLRLTTPIVRVSLERLDEILKVSQSLLISRSAVAERLAGLAGSSEIEPQAFAKLTALLETQRSLLDEMQSKLLRIRMVRFGTLETRFNRAVHSTCLDENKNAVVKIENGDIEIDTQIIDAIVEPVLHLLKNAVVHGIEAPETRRLIGKPATGTIRIRLDADDGEIILSIGDDGAGISVAKLRAKALAKGLITPEAARDMSDIDALNLIFDRGLTTAEKIDLNAGRGVGMSIVKESVESYGGTVIIESEPQRGTTFTIVMPGVHSKKKNNERAGHAVVEDLTAPAMPLVMIVDDSASIRRQSARLVEEAGYRTISAADGAEALEILLSGKFEPDLILSDVEMPHLDGWEFLKYVKTDDNFGHIPIVMVTSLDSEQYRKRAFDLGASDYLVKPYEGAELERILKDVLALVPA